MGQSADEIRQEIDRHREDAAGKIDQLQSQFQGTTEDLRHQAEETVDQVREQVMGTVDDTIESVKENINIEEQIQQRPLVALGAALIGGFVLGGMLGDGGNGQRRSSGSYAGDGSSHSGHSGGGMSDTIRNAVKSSGLEETFSNAAAALMGSVTEQVKQTIDRNVPGFSQKMETAKQTPGSVMDKTKGTQP
jgi:ElaB/YqjD/DUF883 family membrane-anchored ribosome-binding protein